MNFNEQALGIRKNQRSTNFADFSEDLDDIFT